MSNSGKKGEMKVIQALSIMGQRNGSRVDLTRYTITNTPDGGYDIGLHHTPRHFDEMRAVASGDLAKFSNPMDDDSGKLITRIEVKNENNLITKPVAEKFVSDIKRHPDCQGHLLIGNNGLTKGAEQTLFDAVRAYPDKKIGYISNEGVERLMRVATNELESQNKVIDNHLSEIEKVEKED